ncbi:MAG: PAS domain S-box protein [Actinobacteria bacterium]|nr:PAS domain S-box protein [Actinomycetota bacterium]MCG2806824.1 ATP-binding protein [Coriobacteriia bacterium]
MRRTSFSRSMARWMVLGLVVPVVVLGGFAIAFLMREQVVSAQHENMLVARTTRSKVQGKMAEPLQLAHAQAEIMQNPAFTTPDSRSAALKRAAEGSFAVDALMLTDSNGLVIAEGIDPGPSQYPGKFLGLDSSMRNGFAEAMRTHVAVWSDVFVSTITGNRSVSLVDPMDSGEALIVEVSAASFTDPLYQLRNNGESRVSILSGAGVVLYSTDQDLADTAADLSGLTIIRDARAEGEATDIYRYSGQRRLGSAVRVDETGWIILASREWNGVQATAQTLIAFLVLAVSVMVFGAALLARRLARAFGAPVEELTSDARKLAAGEYLKSPRVSRYRELAELADSMHTMSDAVLERESRLRASEERYRFLVESLRGVLWEYDVEADRFVFVAPQAGEMLGYPASAWTDLASWGEKVLDSERAGVLAARADGISEGYPHEMVYRMQAADGDVLWVRDVVSVVQEEDGPPRLIGVILDITAERQSESNRVAAQVAEDASRTKSVFLASMSHELRTPLNAIIGFSTVLAKGMVGPLSEEQERQIQMINDAGRHLLDLVNEILDLSRIEAGRVDIVAAPFEPSQLAAEVAELVQPLVRGDSVSLSIETTGAPESLLTDRERLRQILINLVNNAAKFTEQGSITLAVTSPDELSVAFAVKDTGCGISKENLPLLFREFGRLGVPAVEANGTGLGLVISQGYAKLLGGLITVESTLGQGSVFTLTLPRALPPESGTVS